MDIVGKKISIIGAVRSGIGAAKLAKRLGAIPFVSDRSQKEKLSDSILILEKEGISFEAGQHSDKIFDCDFMIVSPGVPSDSEIILHAKQKNIEIISELEFASWFCKGKIIAITGTNGKTTTTTLYAFTLNKAGFKCYEAGNIGLAFSEIVLDVKADEYVALEVSSFQLDHIRNFRPFISMVLNITPDHMDRYDNSIEKYTASKMSIAVNQLETDYFIYNHDDVAIPALGNTYVNKFGFSLNTELANGAFIKESQFVFCKNSKSDIVCDSNILFIKGNHNKQNALAVLCAAKLIGCSSELIAKSFAEFQGVEHRLEYIGRKNGIDFVNDSKATNVDSVWYALQSFDKPIYLILGGKDKGNDYSKIADLVKEHVNKIYAIGSSAQKVFDYFNPITSTEIKTDFRDCIESVLKDAAPDSVMLLSPACASFDMFDNYEHRGRMFKEEVRRVLI